MRPKAARCRLRRQPSQTRRSLFGMMTPWSWSLRARGASRHRSTVLNLMSRRMRRLTPATLLTLSSSARRRSHARVPSRLRSEPRFPSTWPRTNFPRTDRWLRLAIRRLAICKRRIPCHRPRHRRPPQLPLRRYATSPRSGSLDTQLIWLLGVQEAERRAMMERDRSLVDELVQPIPQPASAQCKGNDSHFLVFGLPGIPADNRRHLQGQRRR